MNLDIDERISSELTRHAPVVDEHMAWDVIQSGAVVYRRRRAAIQIATSLAAVAVVAVGLVLAPNLLSRRADSPIVGHGSAGEVMRAHGEILALTDYGEGIGDLVAVDPASGSRRVIVEHLDDVRHASWSADGRWVAYITHEALWVVDATSEPRKVVADMVDRSGDGVDAKLWSWSATGARIAIVHDSTLSVIDVAAGGTIALASAREALAQPEYLTSPPVWSPDDSTIVVGARGGAIHAIDSATGERSQLVQLPGRNIDSVDELAWSPDGRQLAIRVDFGTHSPLFAVDADGSNVRQLATTTPNNDRIGSFAWSPDGSRIAYIVEGEAGLRLVLVSGDGSMPPRAKTIRYGWGAGLHAPVWSPDGLQIGVGDRAGQLAGDANNVVIDAEASGEFAPLDDRTYESWRGGAYDACEWGFSFEDWC